jgi:hypothetical protein
MLRLRWKHLPAVTPFKTGLDDFPIDDQGTVEYSVLEWIFIKEFQNVLNVCRAEWNVLYKTENSTKKADTADVSEETNLGKLIDDNYSKDLVTCPVHLH